MKNTNKRRGNIWTIARKEFARFFGDKRMAISTVLLPGVMIYVLYSFMGTAMSSMYTVSDDFAPVIYAENLPDSIAQMGEAAELEFLPVTADEIEGIQEELKDKNTETDLLMVFPEDFDVQVASYDNMTATTPAPNVELYYNAASTESDQAYDMMTDILDGYESMLANRFDINAGETTYNMASDEDTTGQIFASMFPMLMMIFMFSGCMAIAPESIAGEKERGTMATMLITPLKRRELAIGKIISLGTIALLSGISSFLGTYLSLPNLMGAASDEMDTAIYGTTDFLLLFAVILSTILVIIGLICVISTYAKSVKEAGTLITPLMIISMLLGITAMFGSGAQTEPYFYLIPLYNSVQCMLGIFSLDYNIKIGRASCRERV